MLLLLTFMAACSPTNEYVIRHSLNHIGLPRSVSHCIADRATDRLGDEHPFVLRQIAYPHQKIRATTVEQLLPQVRDLLEPEIFDALARIGRACERRRFRF
jgi:hypothetical protein